METLSDYSYLNNHRQVWAQKSILRRLYSEQFYQRLLVNRAPGIKTLEIGSGPGFLEEIDPSIWRTDILPSPWVQIAVDAHHLPLKSCCLDNVLGLDVLHHFERPLYFLQEIARVLRPGGRLILIEPWITPFSRLVYTYFHQEGCEMSLTPWSDSGTGFGEHKRAFDGNAAIPYLLITKGQQILEQTIPDLKLILVERFSLFTYLLSLGFKRPNLLPESVYPLIYKFENLTQPLWNRIGALRALIVWECTEKSDVTRQFSYA
jgi:SAM-dependent methyltransferase